MATGIRLLAAFFVFGACMSGVAAVTLLWPGTPLDGAWAINPEGHAGLAAIGWPAATGMAVLSAVMAATAVGLSRRRRWAWWSAAAVLSLNLLGDLSSAILRRDLRTLIGVPIAGLVLWWMARPRVRAQFVPSGDPGAAPNR